MRKKLYKIIYKYYKHYLTGKFNYVKIHSINTLLRGDRMSIRRISTIVFSLSILLLSLHGFSDSDESALQKAKKAAQSAFEAAKSAEAAQKAAQQAVKAAKQAATQAEEAAYHTYMADMARWRSQRLQELPQPPQPPEVSKDTHNPIDTFIIAKWPENEPQPGLCDDFTFIRRVYLDVVGYIPNATDIIEFIEDDREDKRSELVNSLLNQRKAYAEHWAQFWEDALCSNGKHQGGVGTRANFKNYIIESFQQNKPYDVFVAQLLDPTSMRYRGGYVRSENHQDSLLTAANVGQVFLGTKMKCASCHDHFLNFEWTQKRFFGFASYFSEEDLQIIRCEVKHDEYVKPDFIFENGKSINEKTDDLESRLASVTKMLIDPQNPRFASSFVNRLWKRYMGLGFVEPADDFRVDSPPSHPKLLKWMTYEFVSNGYDIQHMIRLILNSRTYQLKLNPTLVDRFEEGRDYPRYFRSPQHRRLTCEQLLDSLNVALKLDHKRMVYDEESTGLTLALGRPATRNEVITNRPEDVAIIQALEFMNGPHFNEIIYDSPLVEQLAEVNNQEKAVTRTFLNFFNRKPSEKERSTTINFLGTDPSPKDWGDMVWALSVSPEFQYIN